MSVRTLSAQGESMDSALAAIPPDLLVPPAPHPRTAPPPKPLASDLDTKDQHLGHHVKIDESWEQSQPPGPAHGHMLEPPDMHSAGPGRRSPSPSRILPQPQGAPVSTTVAKAMAREAAQRVAESSRVSCVFLEGFCPHTLGVGYDLSVCLTDRSQYTRESRPQPRTVVLNWAGPIFSLEHSYWSISVCWGEGLL